MTTKELLKKLEKKNAFWLAWAVIWRWFVIVLVFYAAMFSTILLFSL